MKITLYIQPGAKKTEIAGMRDGVTKLRISAPPVDGTANEAVVKFVALALSIPKSSVQIVKGRKSRMKTVEFDEGLVADRSKLGIFLNV